MATLREFILAQSALPTGNTIRDHILNPGNGGTGETVYVPGIYSITYIGESEELITYTSQDSIDVTYENVAQITISYVGEEAQTIVYVEPEQINVEIVCN